MDVPSLDPILNLEEETDNYSDPNKEFEDILKYFIVEPFGEKLNKELVEIF